MQKKSRPDTEYFGKSDIRKIQKIAQSKREKLAKDEIERLRHLHWRRCAQCGMELEPIPFKGVTIHKCFNCNGVFMEPGTLEMLCGEESHIVESLLDLFKL